MKSSMYTLRRLLALVLVLVMVGSLFAGCNKKDPDPTNPPEPSATVGQTDPTDEPTEPTAEPTAEPTEPSVTVPPVTMGTVNADNLNVRSEPYSTADILKRLAINTRIEIEEQKIVDGVNWGRIAEGWINLNYVTIDGEGTGTGTGTGTVIDNDNNIGAGTVNTDVNKTYNGTITATELHIRKDADADSASVGTYKKGDKVVIIGQRDGWGKTDKGWINMKYVDLNGSSSGGSSSGSSSGTSAGSNTGSVSNGNKIALGTGTVTGTTSLAVRSGPGTNYAQTSFIRQGETYSYYQMSGNWIRLQKGWVNSKYMALEYAIASGTVGTVNTGELHVREDADADSKSLTTVKKDDKVTILEVKGTWGKVEYETGKFGWINLDYVKFSTASSTYTVGEYVITAEGLNYRKEANADSTSLGTYKKNDKVTVTEIAGNWGKTDKGWINLKYAEMTEIYTTGTGEVTASSLNVRDKASTSGKDIGSLKKGDKVTILDTEGYWGKIDYKGKTGWISLKYVEMDPAAKYTVTIGTITGGTVKVSSTSYTKGSVVSLTVTPESGKEIDTLTYTPAGGSAVAITGNKFTMPAANVTINATFKVPTAKYTVTVNSDPAAGGKVTASTTSCAKDTEVILTVAPNSGYVLTGLTALNTTTNTSVTISGNKFTMPAGNVNIVAKFEQTSDPVYTVKSTSDRVTVSTSSAKAGAEISLTINPATGYELDELTVKNAADNSLISVNGTGSTRTFTMPAGNVTVAASFKESTYTVTLTPVTGGTVSTDKNAYKKGDTVTLTVTPADGYKLTKLVANTTDVTSSSAFTMPGSNVTVTATFEKISYTVTVDSAITNGEVKADKTSAVIDDLITLTITPATGYELDKLEVKKGSSAVTMESGTTFKMPAGNVTVTATFKVKVTNYTVTVDSAITKGKVEADKTSVTAGEKVKLTITPDAGYKLSELTVGGEKVTVTGSTYEFTPTANTTVTATFEYVPVKYEVTNTSGTFVNIRKSADSSSEDLGDIPNGTIIESMEGSTATWIKVTYKINGTDVTGWVGIKNLQKK